jgi:anti-anti-sigma factor
VLDCEKVQWFIGAAPFEEMEGNLEHKVRNISDGKEAVLTGRLTFADHKDFRNLIGMLNEPGMKRFVFDLSGVEFIDSAALGMLLLARDTAAGRGIHVVLKGAQGQVKRIMTVANFGALFTIE